MDHWPLNYARFLLCEIGAVGVLMVVLLAVDWWVNKNKWGGL